MNARARIDEIRSLALFRHFPEAKLDELTRVLSARALPAGALVFEDGSAGDELFLLSDGQVRIEKEMEAEGVAELALLSPGDVFGEMALIERAPRSARAVAHTNVSLLVLARADLERWLGAEPQAAVGFFVELLRVLSHRLRRTSNGLVLLYDLSQLTLQRFDDEAGFLLAALQRIVPHLEGEWSAAAFLYNEFNNEVSRVGTKGPRGETLPETLPLADASNRWLDETTYCVALGGKTDTPLGFLVARSESPMSPREKGELEVALTAAGHLVASALQNIRHDAEERMRARLQQRQAHDLL
jgi:CRP/FNR family transcriptional regulator, cyclic AMP receptor protein